MPDLRPHRINADGAGVAATCSSIHATTPLVMVAENGLSVPPPVARVLAATLLCGCVRG